MNTWTRWANQWVRRQYYKMHPKQLQVMKELREDVRSFMVEYNERWAHELLKKIDWMTGDAARYDDDFDDFIWQLAVHVRTDPELRALYMSDEQNTP